MSKQQPRKKQFPKQPNSAKAVVSSGQRRVVSVEDLLGDALTLLKTSGIGSAVAEIERVAAGLRATNVPMGQLLLVLARSVLDHHPKLALEVCLHAQTLEGAPIEATLIAGSLQDRLGDRTSCQVSMRSVILADDATPLQKLRAANLLVRFGEQELSLNAARNAFEEMGRPIEHAATILYIAQVTADWHLVEQLTTQLRQGYADGHIEKINESPRTHLLWCDDEALNLKVVDVWSRRNLPDPILPAPKAQPIAGRRLRVGYLSSDFREHPTARLILGVLRHHDRSQFEVFMYCSGWDDGSALRKEVEAYFDHIHSVAALSDEAAAALMRSHGLDVLVELNGPTRAHRMGILRHRPAPVQIDYLGWPGSVGGRVVDYIVGDYQTIPEGAEELYPEKVIRLHPTYQANDHASIKRAPKPNRKDVGLPEDPSVQILGMFNAINKVHQQVWDTWMAILRAAPNAMLWILDPGPMARKAIARAAQKAGVSVSRILASPKLPPAQHLARIQCCDLMLDPWPYGGHTSTADALFSGVPVLAMEGNNFASRVSSGLLRAAGLDSLICATPNAYGRRAVELLHNPVELNSMRERLIEQGQASQVFDTKIRTRQLEQAYRMAVERAVLGLQPIHILDRSTTAQNNISSGAGVDVKQMVSKPLAAVLGRPLTGMDAKFDYLMSNERDFFPFASPPACRYLLCSTARSGSNLVSDMLQQTQMAGFPMEYLNGSYVAAELRLRGSGADVKNKIDILPYIESLERRRTSPNGWFGLKAHFEHIEGIRKRDEEFAHNLLRRFDCFVQLRRRDKLAQAVSLYRARTTKIWSSLDYRFMSNDDPRREVVVNFDADHIMHAMADIVRQEVGWERCLKSLDLPYTIFWYEDFVADYHGESARLLDFLGISKAINAVTVPSINRQGHDQDPLLEEFRRFLGCWMEPKVLHG